MNDKKTEHEKMLDALLPRSAQSVELQIWPAMGGVQWVKQGYALFRQSPWRWLGALSVLFLVMMAISVLPMVGDILGFLLNPVMNAGLMYFASRLAAGRQARINDLFIGLRQGTATLVGAGALNLLATFFLLVLLVMMAVNTLGEESLQALAAAVEAKDIDAAKAIAEPHMQALLLDALIVLALYVPLAAAFWFAPPLILFKHCGVMAALKLSLQACIRNFLPLTMFSLVFLGWALLVGVIVGALGAIVPGLATGLMLGMMVLFLGVAVAAQWVSFSAIFPQADTEAPKPDGQGDLLL